MSRPIALHSMLKLLIDCWNQAEERVRGLVTDRYTVHDEVFISRLFYGELSIQFREANQRNEFSEAVRKDLLSIAKSEALKSDAKRVSENIIARVSYHEPSVEARTSGDLGFTIIRPSFAESLDSQAFSCSLQEWGLLCQAKRQKENEKWGGFTKKQRSILPQRLPYLALLLYGYLPGERRPLREYRWKPCAGLSFTEVEDWLSSVDLENALTSSEVLTKLGTGTLGTDDKEIIQDVICAGKVAQLSVEITWKEGHRPDLRRTRVLQNTKQRQKTKQQVKLTWG